MTISFESVGVQRSPKGGYGVFATQTIEENTTIRRRIVMREITEENPLAKTERAEHVSFIDGRLYLVGEPDCYLNHSCNPSAYLKFDGPDIWLIARRPITEGEEITLDYLINNSGGDSWDCNCGSSRCRGKTGHSFFDLPHQFQKDYLPLLADWFRKANEQKVAMLEQSLRSDNGA